MKKSFIVVAVLCLAWVTSGFCHPHVFVNAEVKALFDKEGLAAIRNHWVYDELYSAAMIASGDVNGDGVISERESAWFKDAVLTPIEKHNYFNYIQQGTVFLKAEKISNFKATVQNSRLVLDFDVVFKSAVSADYTMLVAVVSDPSNYIQVTTNMEIADVEAPDEIDVEYFDDGLDGLTLFRAFQPNVKGLYLRFRSKK